LKVSIDTSILLDLLLNQKRESVEKLRQHLREHDELAICGIVYGELYPIFAKNNLDLDLFLCELGIGLEKSGKEVYRYAGEAWNQHRRRRKFVCPACGRSIKMKCPQCSAAIRFRQHILADFIIGAFSELHCDGLLTRDLGYYRTYFPRLTLL
jgi:predicted nucleic acid-binding protein